jgi:hypothetical protein
VLAVQVKKPWIARAFLCLKDAWAAFLTGRQEEVACGLPGA